MKILLISGHGARDNGACANGYREADLTREVVNILKEKLKKYADIDVYNQTRDAFKDVNNGNIQVNFANYNYVLEIHFNSFNGSAKGTEIYTTRIEKAKTVEEKIINKLSKFFKTSVVWVLGVILTLFVGIVSVEGTLSSSVDGITAKTAKAAVSSFIPVVGKILCDAIDTVIGCSSILKNATGIVGIVILIGIAVLPIVKLVVLMAIYYLGAALCQPIADGKIISLLEQIGDTFKTLLAIMCSISVMFIIGTTLVIKISNSGMMYR